jgi:hypothetical protein
MIFFFMKMDTYSGLQLAFRWRCKRFGVSITFSILQLEDLVQ